MLLFDWQIYLHILFFKFYFNNEIVHKVHNMLQKRLSKNT